MHKKKKNLNKLTKSMRRTLLTLLTLISMATLVKSQTFSATTVDGREYHLDIIYDNTIQEYLMRTDQVGMKIIREIYASRKAAVTLADSLSSLNSIYKNSLQECDKQISIFVNDKLDLSRQLDLSDQMLNNEVKQNMISHVNVVVIPIRCDRRLYPLPRYVLRVIAFLPILA